MTETNAAYAVALARIVGSDEAVEGVARTLAYLRWPLAPEKGRTLWAEHHWRDEVPNARAVLDYLQQQALAAAGMEKEDG